MGRVMPSRCPAWPSPHFPSSLSRCRPSSFAAVVSLLLQPRAHPNAAIGTADHRAALGVELFAPQNTNKAYDPKQ